jgi:arsenate reductase-like glutaredoxin family protein
MKDNPPPRTEALRLMSETPNLIRRPILVGKDEVIAGFDPQRFEKLL